MVSSKEFSKEELVSILEIIEDANNCVTPGEVSSLLLRTKDLVFADYSVCGVGRLSGGEIKEVLAVVNGNYPAEWLDVYLAERFYRYDPVVRYHKSFSPTQRWSDIYARYDDTEARFVVSNAWDFGIRYGISSSIFTPELDEISIFAFAGRNDSFAGHHKKILDSIAVHMNYALMRAARGLPGPVMHPEGIEDVLK